MFKVHKNDIISNIKLGHSLEDNKNIDLIIIFQLKKRIFHMKDNHVVDTNFKRLSTCKTDSVKKNFIKQNYDNQIYRVKLFAIKCTCSIFQYNAVSVKLTHSCNETHPMNNNDVIKKETKSLKKNQVI